MKLPNLFFGPMGPLIVAAVFKYSHERNVMLGLTASPNQINADTGYTGWDQFTFVEYCAAMQEIYPDANVLLEADHVGNNDMKSMSKLDLHKNLQAYVMSGFHSIHIDPCHSQTSLEDSKELIQITTEYASIKDMNPMLWSVGAESNTGVPEADFDKISKNLSFFKSFCSPTWFVSNTGSLILDGLQIGRFNRRSAASVKELANSFGMLTREHNADYLTDSDIQQRIGNVDSLNIAPQMGQLQSQIVLDLCDKYDIDTKEWRDVCVESGKWKKWLSDPDTVPTHRHITKLCGHYNFQTPEYEALIEQLDKYVDTTEIIVANLYKVVERYDVNFNRGSKWIPA